MLSLDLFNTKYERNLVEGGVDDLEARRIDTLNDRMQELLARAREPAYQANPGALAALKQQFQQVKDERDSYYKVRNETMGYGTLTSEAGLPTPPPSHPTISRQPTVASVDLDNPQARLNPQIINTINRSVAGQSDAQLAGHAARTGLHPRVKSAVDAEIARRAKNADAGMDEAGIPGNIPVEKIPGKEDLLKGKGRTYYEDEVNEDDVEDFIKAGGKITYGKPQKGPRRPGMSLASRHIGGGNDRMKPSRSGRAANTQGKPVVSVEDQKKNSALGEKKLGQLRPSLGTGHDIGRSVKKFRTQRGLDEGQVSDEVDHRGDVDTSANIEVPGVDLKNDTFKITYNKKPYTVKIQNFSQEGLGRWQIADYDVDIINANGKNLIDLIDWNNDGNAKTDRQIQMVNTIIAYLDTQHAADIQLMSWREVGIVNSTAEDLYQEIQDFYKNDQQKIDKATAWLAQNIEDAEERQVFADFVKNPVSRPAKTKYIPKEYLVYVAFSYSREGNTELTPGMNLKTIQLDDPDDEEELQRKVDELIRKVQFKFDAFENKIVELGEQLGFDSEPDLGSGFGQREIVWDNRIRTTVFSKLNKDMQQRRANAILKLSAAIEKYVASFNNTLIKIGLPGITEYSTWSGVLGDQLTDQQVRYFATPEGFANLASGKIDVAKMIDDNVDKQGVAEHGDGMGRSVKKFRTQRGLDEKSTGPLDQKLQRLKVQARRQFPRAHTDDEALVLKLLDKETQDDQANRRTDARQDAELKQNFALDRDQEDEIQDLQAQVGVKEHGGGIGPKQRWQDLMPEQYNDDDEDYEDEDEDLRLRSGDYVRDQQDGEYGEVFRMQGDPYERRVRILDRDGKGWYIEPSRLTRVDPTDPDVQRYFGKQRVRDMDESGVADQVKKVFKDKAGKPVGEIGIDPESSPGNGEWYVHHYATGYSVVGFDSAAEAKRELLYVHKHPDAVEGHPSTKEQGVAEGSQEINWVKPNFDFEWHEVEEQSRMKQVPVDVRQYYQKHFPNKDAWLKAVQNGKAVVVPPDHAYEIRNAPFDKASLQKVLAPTGHEGPIGPAKEKRVNDLFDKGQVEMPIILKTSQGLWLIGGKTRLGTANYVKGLPAKVWLISGKQGVAEGWSDRALAQRTGGARTPYSVYIKGKKWKDFESDDHAEAVANKLRAKFKADGRDPSVITVAPTDYDQPIKEDQDTSGVERAILNRIMVAHTDLLMKFGPDKVMQAAEEVAYNVGDVDEIGTSDVSAYVAQVKQILGAAP
jgi:hypothetical protein